MLNVILSLAGDNTGKKRSGRKTNDRGDLRRSQVSLRASFSSPKASEGNIERQDNKSSSSIITLWLKHFIIEETTEHLGDSSDSTSSTTSSPVLSKSNSCVRYETKSRSSVPAERLALSGRF